jgi:SAM-dependent methyltransferase
MSDNARPDPTQLPPVEPSPLDKGVDPIAAAFAAPSEGVAPPTAPAADGAPPRDDGKELLILPTDADEPPIYFEPDSESSPFLPAMTPAPGAAAVAASISVDLDEDSPLPPTVNSPSDAPPSSPPVGPERSASDDAPAAVASSAKAPNGAVTTANGPQAPEPSSAAARAPLEKPAAASEDGAAQSAGPATERSVPCDPPPPLASSLPSSDTLIVPSSDVLTPSSDALLPSSDPARRMVSHSTSVPPPRVRTNRSQRPGASSNSASARPPNMIEPARIIAVLGSDVPAYTKEAANEEIEDLDDSEAQELVDGVPSERSKKAGAAGAEARSGERAPASAPMDSSATPLTSDATQKRAKPPSPPSARAARKAAEDAADTKAWWEDMFSDDFLRAIPVLSPPQLERETAFVARSLNVAKGKRLLDLACGAGQHAVELAARGYAMVGYDLSQAQLAWAGELAQERGQTLEFVHGDMRDLDFNAAFDGVYCWNTSFGFFEEDKNLDIARRVFRALKPGGRFLLDVVNRDFIVSQQPGQTWFEGDGCVCIDDVGMDFVSSRIRVKRTLMLDNGRNRECNYSIRLYSLHELGELLMGAGFKVLQASGRPELPGVFMGPTSPRIIVLAAKPAA